ncbi:MAG TPA: CheR family methyltransferase [Verrucomicrobiae bacterium]|nr:CheR family methyltransferase [Verrucomicrobiae bacterium]
MSQKEKDQKKTKVSQPTKPTVAPAVRLEPPHTEDEGEGADYSEENTQRFPVIGIGASAGGLEAFTQLLEHLPPDTGMAFVFIQHLAAGQESMLTEILARSTKMLVHQVKNDMKVEPNNVYVIPPDVYMTIINYTLKLAPQIARIQKPIDAFLNSLARDLKSLAIGVVLSGTGSDGTEGIKSIYAEGGITFAQDEDSAKYPGMPHSAISLGVINFVLPAAQIAEELTRIGQHPYLSHAKLALLSPEMAREDSFRSILALLKLNFNVDFFAYKQSTVNRRISRRMVIHKIEKMDEYAGYLRNNKQELQALYDDLLIGVTSFFREPETFNELCQKVFPQLIRDRTMETPIRVWVPGCSTGEEVYSIAIVLQEFLERNGKSGQLHIFGTDISEKNIERARQGVYPESIVEPISADRKKHFFSKTEQGFQINKSIRDMCIFAKQDLTHDPPFSNLDLISCRNVLIYLKPQAQKRIIPLFHYALKQNGYLILGRSESIGSYDSLFSSVDKGPIYMRKPVPSRVTFEPEAFETYFKKELPPKIIEIEKPFVLLQKQIEKIITSRAPPAIVINEKMEIQSFHGETSKYISPMPGQASFDLMKMAKQDLSLELQTAIFIARKQKTNVRRENVRYRRNGDYQEVNFEIIPVEVPNTGETFYTILFEDVCPTSIKHEGEAATENESVARTVNEELRRELAATKENLQTIIEEQEATNEELRSALEEVQSSNEELQSTNEELETAKEELQSTNEELNTLNEELGRRNAELINVKDDLNNVFNNIDIGVLVLSRDLKIRLFTPAAEKMFNLINSDVGRPINDIRLKINVPALEKNLSEVIENLTPLQQKIKDEEGHLYQMRIRPYLTGEKKIEGVVLSLVNVDSVNT